MAKMKTKKKAAPRNPGKKVKQLSASRGKTGATRAKKAAASAKPAAAVKKTSLPKSPFSAREKKEYRLRLMRMRDIMTGQIDFLVTDNLNRSANDNDLDFRSEEAGTDHFDRDFALNRAGLNQDTVFEIDQAINRIEMNTFGVCESCEKPIEKRRMSALPYSRLCIKCKAAMESDRTRFRSFDSQALFPAVDKTGPEPGPEEE